MWVWVGAASRRMPSVSCANSSRIPIWDLWVIGGSRRMPSVAPPLSRQPGPVVWEGRAAGVRFVLSSAAVKFMVV